MTVRFALDSAVALTTVPTVRRLRTKGYADAAYLDQS
jgi:hypothetical protein